MVKGRVVSFCISCILRHPLKFINASWDYLLSHHPSCDYYRNDYVEFRGVKLCIGCFFATPTVIIFILLDISLGIWDVISPRLSLIVPILILVQVYYYLNVSRWVKITKIVSKICLGILYAIILLYPLHLPFNYLFKFMITFLLYMLLNAFIAVTRIYKDWKKCMKCPMHKDYPLCDGYKDLVKSWIREGFAKVSDYS